MSIETLELVSASKLSDITQTKSYTAYPDFILNIINSDFKLTACASKLWQFFYSRAKFKKDCTIQLSYKFLAEYFGRSKQTIIRWVNSLKKNGYLLIKENFRSNKGQTVNTFSIVIPAKFLKEVDNRKDRLKALSNLPNKSIISEDKKCSHSNVTSNNFDTPPSNTIDTPKDININTDNKNNNTKNIVVISDLEEKIKEEKSLTKLEFQCIQDEKEAQLAFQAINYSAYNRENYLKKYDIWNEIAQKLTAIQNYRYRLNEKIQQLKKVKVLKLDSQYSLKLPGKREINDFTHKRILSELSKMGYKNEILTELTNGIIFEVRFGSLVNSKDTTELPIEKSVSIALKLIRQGRWLNPKKIKIS